MLVHFRIRIRSQTRHNPLHSFLNPLHNQKVKNPKLLKMVNDQSNSGRPVCPSCSKPARLCLCTRIRTPGLQNSVKVTILQHSLEKKHPLNSTRIAKLGLENLTVATVSDVNFEARFIIWLLEPGSEMGLVGNGLESLSCDEVLGFEGTHKLSFEHVENVIDSEFNQFGKVVKEKENNLSDCNGGGCSKDTGSLSKCVIFEQNLALSTNDGLILGPDDELFSKKCNCEKGTFDLETPHNNLVEESTLNEAISDEKSDIRPGFDRIQSDRKCGEEPVIAATIGKYGVISSLSHSWISETNMNLASPGARDALAKGFVIKKLQTRQLDGSKELEEYEEFELEVPAGSILLFPSEQAIGVDGLEDFDFKVKNLIVLDGTWAKAKRMYNENPWLKLLPHLKLDLDKISLYREVRHQPKAGYLSTIESIVHALKAVGDNSEGLDNLLDVFESMVGDQRRSKDERLSKVPLE